MKKLEPVFDEQEGAELRTLRNHAAIVMVIASVVFALIGRTPPPRWWAVPVFVAFFGALWHLYGVRLPRILQRRYESEAHPQPRRAWMYETIGHAAGATLTGTTFMLILMRHC
jgi:uncharacterized membrane protein